MSKSEQRDAIFFSKEDIAGNKGICKLVQGRKLLLCTRPSLCTDVPLPQEKPGEEKSVLRLSLIAFG